MWSQATVNRHFSYNVMGNQLMSVAPLMESPMFEGSAQEVDRFYACTSDIAASTFVVVCHKKQDLKLKHLTRKQLIWHGSLNSKFFSVSLKC